MLRLPNFINRTLSVRLSLMVVSAMAILLMASLVVMLHFSRKAVKEEALQKAAQTLEGTVQQIDNILLSVEQASGNIFFALLPYLNEPDKIFEYSRRLVASNPYVTGCAIAMKPYYYKDRELFMAYVYRSANRTDAPLIESETFGNCPYTEQAWYSGPMASGKPGWLNPLKGMDFDTAPITTFCLPIPGPDGKPVAVIGVDVSLSLLSHIVLATKASPNSYCTLLADDGSFIVHPDSSKLLHHTVFTQMDKMSDTTMKEAAEAMVSGETGYREFRMAGKDYYIFYKPFKRAAVRGRSMEELKWSAGIIYPEDDIFGEYNRLLYYVLAIAIVGLIVLFVLSRAIIHKQLIPLRLLTASAQRIARGNYNEKIPDSHQQDEIGRLQDHFQLMQQSLAANISELEQLTATLQERGEELNTAYERVRQADRMKTVFLHNMSDQMEEPAKAIMADVNALCDSSRRMDKDEVVRLTDDIGKQGEAIADLLDNLLRVSDEETNKEARP